MRDDPEIGRFFSIDRFAGKYPFLTPYQYAADNLVLFVDVNGDTIIISEAMSNSEALAHFFSTEQGKTWASQFAYEGQEITVAGKTFSFKNAGKFSTKNLNFAGINDNIGPHIIPSNSIEGDYFIGQEGVQSYNIYLSSGGSLIDQADALFHDTQHAYMFAAGGANGRGGYGKVNKGRMILLQHIVMLTPAYFEPHRNFLKEIGASSSFVRGKIVSLMWQARIDLGLSGRFPTHVNVNKLIPEVLQILLERKKFLEK